MEHLIKLENAVSGFCVKERYIYCICRKAVYKIDKESGMIVNEKEIFEKDGSARILIADENRIFISDFCTLGSKQKAINQTRGKGSKPKATYKEAVKPVIVSKQGCSERSKGERSAKREESRFRANARRERSDRAWLAEIAKLLK